MIADLDVIVGSIVKEGALFLKNEMQLDLIEIKAIKDISFGKYIGAIELIGQDKVVVVSSIDKELFEVIFNKMFQIELDEDERKELENDMSNEILNTIVGLSIKYFPLNCDTLELQPPLEVTKTQLKDLIGSNKLKRFKITTQYGSLYLAVFVQV